MPQGRTVGAKKLRFEPTSQSVGDDERKVFAPMPSQRATLATGNECSRLDAANLEQIGAPRRPHRLTTRDHVNISGIDNAMFAQLQFGLL